MLDSGLGTSWGVEPGEAAGLSRNAAAPVVSETVDDCATTWLAPTSSTVGAELTPPTNTTGATAGLGTVTDAAVELGTTSGDPAETSRESGFDSSAADSGFPRLGTDSSGPPAFKDKGPHYLNNSLSLMEQHCSVTSLAPNNYET